MSGKELKIAVFGCGRMGLHHIKAIGFQKGARLVAVADPGANEEELRPRLPAGTKVYGDAGELLATERPDVVHVVTPPETHAELARLALEHGANVYVEKPFALDVETATAIIDLAQSRGLQVCAAHQVLFQDAGRKYPRYLPLIGEPIHIESYFSFKTVRRGGITPVEQLIDILPHPVYLLLSAFENSGIGTEAIELQSMEVDPEGEVRAVLRGGQARAVLIVSLRGRPIESYLKIVGTNGSINADFVLSGVTRHPGPGASAISAVLKPYSQARQISFNTTATIFRMIFKRHKSYAGLGELLEAFYGSIAEKRPAPVPPASILKTVEICARIGASLQQADADAEAIALERLGQAEARLTPPAPDRGMILVTGGTGFLGRVVVEELRGKGWPVRVVTRRIPQAGLRVPGVEYVRGDISRGLSDELFSEVDTVVHLAAETAGGKVEHERNTIAATRHTLEAAARNGVRRFVNISSIAVLVPSATVGAALNESSPVDAGNLGRGPYVWAKAEAERLVDTFGKEHGMQARTIRLGPLVDFRQFTPPGRLGREVGPLYVAVGPRRGDLSVCDVGTAAQVIRHYVAHFDQAPAMLNLVESPAPTRAELAALMRGRRLDLTVLWMPEWLLKLMSGGLKFALRLLKPGAKPLDLHAAFASERYDSTLAARIISQAKNP